MLFWRCWHGLDRPACFSVISVALFSTKDGKQWRGKVRDHVFHFEAEFSGKIVWTLCLFVKYSLNIILWLDESRTFNVISSNALLLLFPIYVDTMFMISLEISGAAALCAMSAPLLTPSSQTWEVKFFILDEITQFLKYLLNCKLFSTVINGGTTLLSHGFFWPWTMPLTNP